MQYYTTEQVAEIFAISPKTVRKLITTGKMKAVKNRDRVPDQR